MEILGLLKEIKHDKVISLSSIISPVPQHTLRGIHWRAAVLHGYQAFFKQDK